MYGEQNIKLWCIR